MNKNTSRKYLVKPIENRSEWENFLTKAHSTHVLSWEWDEFERSNGFVFENLGIFECQNNRLVGLLPVKHIRAKRGNYLHLRHGPVIDWDNSDLVEFCIHTLCQKAKNERFALIRISPLIENNPKNNELLQRLGFKSSNIHEADAERTVVVDLSKPEDQILASFRKNTRYDIRKAQKLGVDVAIYTDLSAYSEFIELYRETVARQKWTAYSDQYIRREFEIFAKYDSAVLAIARLDGKPVATSIFIIHQNQAIYHHSGSTRKYGNIPATHLLHWEAMKYFKARGLLLYNFWGVCAKNNTKHPWFGLSVFKRGFSDTELSFVHPYDREISLRAKLIRLYDLVEARTRGYAGARQTTARIGKTLLAKPRPP